MRSGAPPHFGGARGREPQCAAYGPMRPLPLGPFAAHAMT